MMKHTHILMIGAASLAMSSLLVGCKDSENTTTSAEQTEAKPAVLSVEDAMKRLSEYGLVDDSKSSQTLVKHFNRLKNGDESIHDYPYVAHLLMLGGDTDRAPLSCIEAFLIAGADVNCAVSDGNQGLSPLIKLAPFLRHSELHFQPLVALSA